MSELELNTIKYHCCDENRRSLVAGHTSLNGIDFVEISEDQKILFLHFLKSVSTTAFVSINFIINGGERVESVNVVNITKGPDYASPLDDNVIVLYLNTIGDYSTYTLQLVENKNEIPLKGIAGFDHFLSKIDFSFKVLCPDNFDCKEDIECIVQESKSPAFINYLAKDYSSFKQVIHDRLSQLIPDWQGGHAPDLENTLIELLAYTADYLSYRQDAITSEAYLGTSRKRVSATRHARLADYKVSNGCNARTWIHLRLENTNQNVLLKKEDDIKFLTQVDINEKIIWADSVKYNQALISKPTVFELMHDIELNHDHNEMHFYTFGDAHCCLHKGATSAVLFGDKTSLKANDFVMLVENRGADSGLKSDADLSKRHVVRIQAVEKIMDYDFNINDADPTIELTKITWDLEDALPFSLCISSVSDQKKVIEDVSVVLGNIALCDHGLTREDDSVENSSVHPSEVPKSIGHFADTNKASFCEENDPKPIPVRYRPSLKHKLITFSENLPFIGKEIDNTYSATGCIEQDVHKTLPVVRLYHVSDSAEWTARPDLLTDSGSEDKHFVGELETDGILHIRFGDDIKGKRPNAGKQFKAHYRLGNGPAGNIGYNTLCHIVLPASLTSTMMDKIIKITNPLPASGGTRPESLEEIKQYAPVAFRSRQERAVTSDDYAFLAQREDRQVQKAAAHFRWTGSWNTAFVELDFKDDTVEKQKHKKHLANALDKYRLAGMDVVMDDPLYVSMKMVMTVCISPYAYRSEVMTMLKRRFSTAKQADGSPGFFNADNFSFGDTLYLSNIYKVAQGVPGVLSVDISIFHKLKDESNNAINIDSGKIEFGKREIPRLDNNPNFRERGFIEFIIQGGK